MRGSSFPGRPVACRASASSAEICAVRVSMLPSAIVASSCGRSCAPINHAGATGAMEGRALDAHVNLVIIRPSLYDIKEKNVMAAATTAQVEPLEHATIRQVTWRLMPVLMLGYFCAYLDRVNVGFAKLTMQNALGMTDAIFGFGAGVFFVGYFLAEIPSNLILNNVGARKWIARILLTWGIISALTAFVWNEWTFYAIRFLLGLAEAGFYPGIVLYLTWWFPSYYRSRMMGIFQSASVISLIIGPPVSAYLLQLDGFFGLQGWQWLFLIEALPPIIMCVITWMLLTDRPMEALWLRPEQR